MDDIEQKMESGILLDFSKQCLKKIPKQDDAQNIKTLLLDENELQKIDNIDSYLRIEKLSLCKNQLLRMYGVCRLHNLKELHLAFNGILTIEGLKELSHLTHLNLEGNNIKTIEHLNTNINLEYLNLSQNSIGSISDISFLKYLKELYLHGNRITHLRQCDKYLPISLEQLNLSKNVLADLNEICTLSNLINLYSIWITDNPCVQMTGSVVGFDHRPFVLNWCTTLKLIDGFVVNPIESLKAEWLYSQGRGRQFRVGEQMGLARYLSTVCPLSGEIMENENERKLRLILSKAQQHQRQLQEEVSENTSTSTNNSPSSSRRKGPASRIQSPRFYRLGRQRSPDSMSSSYHGNASGCTLISSNTNDSNCTLNEMTTSIVSNMNNVNSDNIMIQSLDPIILINSNNLTVMQQQLQDRQTSDRSPTTPIYNKCNISSLHDLTVRSHSNVVNDQILNQHRQGKPLTATTKIVPVPESLLSPDCPTIISTSIAKNLNNIPTQQQPSSHLRQLYSNLTKSCVNKQGNLIKINGNNIVKTGKLQVNSPILKERKLDNNINSAALKTTQNNNHNGLHCLHSLNDHHPNHETFTINRNVEMNANSSLSINALSSDDDSDHINVDKIQIIRDKAAEKCVLQQQQNQENCNSANIINNDLENSAIMIQKMWRGYSTRRTTVYIAGKLQKKRTQEYIIKLTQDMETTKLALENERKIQQLQMQAINALWKKVSSMQTSTTTNATTALLGELVVPITSSSTEIQNDTIQKNSADTMNPIMAVQDLAKTCSILTNQVQQLQGSMRDILNCMTAFCSLPSNETIKIEQKSKQQTNDDNKNKGDSSTQTEIIAVHTPQLENLPTNFLFHSNSYNNNKKMRPSTLTLPDSVIDSSVQSQTQQKSPPNISLSLEGSSSAAGNEIKIIEENHQNEKDVAIDESPFPEIFLNQINTILIKSD